MQIISCEMSKNIWNNKKMFRLVISLTGGVHSSVAFFRNTIINEDTGHADVINSKINIQYKQ